MDKQGIVFNGRRTRIQTRMQMRLDEFLTRLESQTIDLAAEADDFSALKKDILLQRSLSFDESAMTEHDPEFEEKLEAEEEIRHIVARVRGPVARLADIRTCWELPEIQQCVQRIENEKERTMFLIGLRTNYVHKAIENLLYEILSDELTEPDEDIDEHISLLRNRYIDYMRAA